MLVFVLINTMVVLISTLVLLFMYFVELKLVVLLNINTNITCSVNADMKAN